MDNEVSEINQIIKINEKPRLKNKSTLGLINDNNFGHDKKLVTKDDNLDQIQDSVHDGTNQENSIEKDQNFDTESEIQREISMV